MTNGIPVGPLTEFCRNVFITAGAPGVDELLYAGEIEHRLERKAIKQGVELPAAILDDLKGVARNGIDAQFLR